MEKGKFLQVNEAEIGDDVQVPGVQFSKVIVMLIIIMNIWFTVAVLSVFAKTGVEPTSLVVAFFGFTTGELWLMATIKKTKVKGVAINANNKSGLDQEINK